MNSLDEPVVAMAVYDDNRGLVVVRYIRCPDGLFYHHMDVKVIDGKPRCIEGGSPYGHPERAFGAPYKRVYDLDEYPMLRT